MFRRALLSVLILSTLLFVGCFTNKKVNNPIADVNSKQPDKVLYDRAMDAMKHNKFDVARLSLQTLINTYPDSEYVARAKLAIGDSWYAEGGSAAMAQAESEYKDFITFFPNMTEASEAQMKIANIHYNEMEKADRDYTHAKRAEEEYRQLIMQFPDSPLVPEAKKKLLAVQEVLGEREFMIGHYYYMRESWPAAIARFKSLVDTYPLYSGAAHFVQGQGGIDQAVHRPGHGSIRPDPHPLSGGGPRRRCPQAVAGPGQADSESNARGHRAEQEGTGEPKFPQHLQQDDAELQEGAGCLAGHESRRAHAGGPATDERSSVGAGSNLQRHVGLERRHNRDCDAGHRDGACGGKCRGATLRCCGRFNGSGSSGSGNRNHGQRRRRGGQ